MSPELHEVLVFYLLGHLATDDGCCVGVNAIRLVQSCAEGSRGVRLTHEITFRARVIVLVAPIRMRSQ